MKLAQAGSGDLWMVPRANFHVMPGFNVRPKDAPSHAEHIRWIADRIKTMGYDRSEPIAAFVDAENRICVTDGHCRLEAVDLAVSEGCEIEVLPTIISARGTTMEDLNAGLIIKNAGRDIPPLGKAVVVKRFITWGWEIPAIAERVGLSEPYIELLLQYLEMPAKVRKMVEMEQVAAATALKAVKRHKEKAYDVLQAALKGTAKVTPRAVAPKRDLLAEGAAMVRSFGEGWTVSPEVIKLVAFMAGVDEDKVREALAS